MKFKAKDKVVFENENFPNNRVMTILSGNQKRNGFEMVTLLLEGGRGIAYANQLRPATAEEVVTGFRAKGASHE